MDSILDKPLALKIIAFLITIFMFIQVSNSEISQKLRSFKITSKKQTIVIEKVPVQIYYDEDNLVVTGVPLTVDVKITGPKSIVLQAKSQRDFQAAIYLTDPDIGSQKVSIVTKNLSEKLRATIIPGFVTINVQERITKLFPVETSLKDQDIAEGFNIAEVKVLPEKVTVIGGKDVIQRIAHVYAVLDTNEPISKDLRSEVKLIAVDSKSNKLNVTITPDRVSINLKLNMPSKTLPINTKLLGEPEKGFLVENISLSENEVTVFSKDASFNNITGITLPIDVSGKSQTFETEVKLTLPDGILKTSQSSVKAVVTIVAEGTKILKDIPINVLNVDTQKFDVNFPDGDKVDLTIRGLSQNVNAVQINQFTITVDGSNLESGKKSVKVQVEGPENVSWNLSTEEITIELIKK
ncbi:MAG: YbbR-like protein [Bacillales bacterium]|jgi:YbbR domain-containing protein|nr:YbbR-like protein [Bacillales bacterium]